MLVKTRKDQFGTRKDQFGTRIIESADKNGQSNSSFLRERPIKFVVLIRTTNKLFRDYITVLIRVMEV